jgi:hypothetical protein
VGSLDVCRVSYRYLTLSVMDTRRSYVSLVTVASRVVAANLVA